MYPIPQSVLFLFCLCEHSSNGKINIPSYNSIFVPGIIKEIVNLNSRYKKENQKFPQQLKKQDSNHLDHSKVFL